MRSLFPSLRSLAGGLLLVASMIVVACGQDDPASGSLGPPEGAEPAGRAVDELGNGDSSSYLLLNQKWVEGLSTDSVDLEDVDEMFWHIFSRLPGEVTVYPSENYYYFILYLDKRQLWGNIRLAAGRRERGRNRRTSLSHG